MSAPQWHSQVVPARLAFLAIYNPTLGPTDDSFPDQLVFYFSRAAHEARAAARKSDRADGVGADAARAEENERLRQIGLAQGMVDFARSFANGAPVDSIETEKSRIVLHELETGWWILASVDLTRLPALASTSQDGPTKAKGKAEGQTPIEYSSREVSPPGLLLTQLLHAHHIFCLHHGPSLSDLFVRLSRERFCGTVERFWLRFARNWDVLLHGNPAADIFDGIKLASGGELGFGVGEEDWGSGEREVLEDLVHRTEGLVDGVGCRFGEPAGTTDGKHSPEATDDTTWLRSGRRPLATDGVIFGGIGAMTRPSLRSISLWMQQVYTHGESAYGVRDNPLRERRKRRRKGTVEPDDGGDPPPTDAKTPNGDAQPSMPQAESSKPEHPKSAGLLDWMPADKRPQMYPRVASQDHATTPEETATPPPDGGRARAPPPIAAAAERALAEATRGLENSAGQQRPNTQEADAGTTMGIPDQYMKYLTFGLSTLAKSSAPKRPAAPRAESSALSIQSKGRLGKARPEGVEDDAESMTQLDPMPYGEGARSLLAMQRREENRGHFLIGFNGDLDIVREDDEASMTDGSIHHGVASARIILRTVHVDLNSGDIMDSESPSLQRSRSDGERDGSDKPATTHHRLRVVLYIRRPFMYCFLFQARTSALSLVKFYVSLHRNLMPIHKPLLASTDISNIAERIEASHGAPSETDASSITSSNRLPAKSADAPPIYHLIFDPQLLTLHTSLPNIPEPGTPAAEGFQSDAGQPTRTAWTRVDALSVHGQVLATVANVRGRRMEIERMSKTSRGWWVVWMSVSPSSSLAPADETRFPPVGPPVGDDASNATLTDKAPESAAQHAPARASGVGSFDPESNRMAFLVRKAAEPDAAVKSPSAGSRAVSGMMNTMTFGLGSWGEEEKTGGASAGWGPGALAGGIGVDARKYVEGLLSLNR